MAAANDSQGLKIATAILGALAFILAVTTYFGYSSYFEAQAKAESEEKKAREQTQSADSLQREMNSLKGKLGGTNYESKENYAAVDALLKVDLEKLTNRAKETNTRIKETVGQLRQAGIAGPKIEELSKVGDDLVNRFTTVPDGSIMSTLDTMLDLASNQSYLSTEIGKDYLNTRRNLENTNNVNKEQLDVEVNKFKETKSDLEKEHQEYEEQRSTLTSKLDELQSTNSQQAQEVSKLKTQLAQLQEDSGKQRNDLLRQMRAFREQIEKTEVRLDKRDGLVSFVDYNRSEIRTNISRRMGAHEQMKFSIFDKDAPGLPSDKPKATVELTQVGDEGSIARIIRQTDSLNPIRIGDQLYSPSWSPDDPQKFALIGKIDIDRDGRDDRADLKRMIESAGGTVVFDLPPAGIGQETGDISALTNWYVVDERKPIHPQGRASQEGVTTEAERKFLDRKTEILGQAHLLGIRPIRIESLLSNLGYSYGMVKPGRVEAIDRKAVDALINPKGNVGNLPGSETPPAPNGGNDRAPR